MRDSREGFLFNNYHISDIIQKQEKELIAEIDGFDKNYILNTSMDVLCKYLEDKYYTERTLF